ncbi:MAG: SOS response-associated peptidase [Deltaproteobacteria bacterium]
MCGRYTITVDTDELSDRFGCIVIQKSVGPRYNMAPQQMAPIIINNRGRNEMHLMKWGLVPFWAKESSIGSRLINARWETLHEKPAFKHLLRCKRCLVPADGYYEWQKIGREKHPHRIILSSREVFGLAGLWDEWIGADGKKLTSFTIVTTDAAPAVSKLHERMPFILPPEMEGQWLGDTMNMTGRDIRDWLSAFRPVDDLVSYPVSGLVNSVVNDQAGCIVAVK